jgi:hypothetical protein
MLVKYNTSAGPADDCFSLRTAARIQSSSPAGSDFTSIIRLTVGDGRVIILT